MDERLRWLLKVAGQEWGWRQVAEAAAALAREHLTVGVLHDVTVTAYTAPGGQFIDSYTDNFVMAATKDEAARIMWMIGHEKWPDAHLQVHVSWSR